MGFSFGGGGRLGSSFFSGAGGAMKFTNSVAAFPVVKDSAGATTGRKWLRRAGRGRNPARRDGRAANARPCQRGTCRAVPMSTATWRPRRNGGSGHRGDSMPGSWMLMKSGLPVGRLVWRGHGAFAASE